MVQTTQTPAANATVTALPQIPAVPKTTAIQIAQEMF
jgi:hypothetical protein